jgi:hypothetical protein
MTHQWAACGLAACAITVAGCGGGHNDAASTTSQQRPTTSATNPRAELASAIREALRENGRLSIFVLSHNRIPAWATRSTRGPALAALRASAATRRRQGVRVRSLSDRLEIIDVQIAPSFATATATVQDRQRVLPYRHGKPDRPTRTLDERVRIELRRVARDVHFVVWRVLPAS